MNLEELLIAACKLLYEREVPFALAGGLAASMYRTEKRFTQDLDLAIAVPAREEQMACELLQALGFSPTEVQQADLEGGPMFARKRRSSPAMIMVGRHPGEPGTFGVDLLLSSIPWVPSAVARAQSNQVKFGALEVPCLTVEDVIVAKLYALKNSKSRFKDLDDLSDIFQGKGDLDLAYITGRMIELQLPLPAELKDTAHYLIRRAARRIPRRGKA